MSWWSRVVNVFRGDRLSREIDEELESHLEAAVQQGRDRVEARQALGSALRHREASRDIKLLPWLDSVRADALFGWRQLKKRKVTSAAVILSLGLAVGACTSAFRIIDALLLRPLPVADPERLYALSREGISEDGKLDSYDSWAYPAFRLMRNAVKDQAELLAISYAERMDLTYQSDQEMEKACVQYVSGWMFNTFGLRAALGRLLVEDDDLKPDAHPYAVLSYAYWVRRFGRDPRVIGRAFRMGGNVYEIVGVCEAPFTGTEPGTFTDIFVPAMMHPGVTHSDWTWLRILAHLKPGVAVGPLRARLQLTSRAFEEERSKGFSGMSQESLQRFLDQKVLLEPAAAGASGMQQDYSGSLVALGVLVTLVLLIASANVANLLTAQTAARARELALRVSIGAGRWRLVQLVLVESAWLAFLAAMIGALFAGWSAPLVVSMVSPPDNPVRLSLPADWRVLGFGLALTAIVMLLLSLGPALRASAVKPVSALKGGEDPRSRRHLMLALIAAQVAFCFLVLFVAGLFVTTFDRLSGQPTGFIAARLLTLDAVAPRDESPVYWDQVADHLRSIPGVEAVALAEWPLLSGGSWNDAIAVNGGPPSNDMAYFLKISPGWVDAMRIAFIGGRDFRASDTDPGVAIVNEAFAKRYFPGENPVGKFFERATDEGGRTRFQIVGLVGDARYRSLRNRIPPVAYFPFRSTDAHGSLQSIREGTFIVRTTNPNPLALAAILRQEVPRARPELRVRSLRTQSEIDESHTVRERLLARLAFFFSIVALSLAGVGVFGVLNYSVLQRRRELGIRIALGAPVSHVARGVVVGVLAMVFLGGAAGLALGLASVRYITTLLYGVKATDLSILTLPWLTVVTAALVAALPPVIRAVRIDPVKMLRVE
jgi:putative ABC transport system permease protein